MTALIRRQKAANSSSEKKGIEAQQPKKHVLLPRLSLTLIYLIAFIFLILVEIGNTRNVPVIRSTWFFRLSLADIIPDSVPDSELIDSIARTIGLHDFYLVGLWNYCEGFDSDPDGITDCSKPIALYWFDPVQIIINELLSGATISLPTEVTSALSLVRLASRWMFACFLVGIILTFICIFISPFIISSHPRYFHRGSRIFLRSIPLTIITFLAALFTTIGTVVATVMFVIFRNVFAEYASGINIGASLGKQMFAFMWIATAMDLVGFIWSLGNFCAVCCCSGKRKARKQGLVDEHGNPVGTKPA